MRRMDDVQGLRMALVEAAVPLKHASGRPLTEDAAGGWAAWPMAPMGDRGLAHRHVRLLGTGLLARIPKQSQMRLAAADNLRYQAACFERAAPSLQVPRLHALLMPSAHLPHGALLVDEIVGRPARLPQDLPALMRCLAALHALPVPPAADRAPLLCAADPLRDLQREVESQWAQGADGAGLAATRAMHEGLNALAALCAGDARPPRTLIAFDGHPGNFVLREDGVAVLVDLEKCRYAYAGLDLAHATLYTSTTWDAQVQAVLSAEDLQRAYAAWEHTVGVERAQDARAWHAPLAQAMWLWSLSWCAQWLALSRQPPKAGADGEDWSSEHSDPALVAHVRERVLHYLSPEGIAGAQRGLEALSRWSEAAAA